MLADAEIKANQDQAEAMNRFRSWATQRVPGAANMNVGSGAQIRQLLFAGVENQKAGKGVLEHEKVFKVGHSPRQIISTQSVSSLPADQHQQAEPLVEKAITSCIRLSCNKQVCQQRFSRQTLNLALWQYDTLCFVLQLHVLTLGKYMPRHCH